jgi:hypothetical protein
MKERILQNEGEIVIHNPCLAKKAFIMLSHNKGLDILIPGGIIQGVPLGYSRIFFLVSYTFLVPYPAPRASNMTNPLPTGAYPPTGALPGSPDGSVPGIGCANKLVMAVVKVMKKTVKRSILIAFFIAVDFNVCKYTVLSKV